MKRISVEIEDELHEDLLRAVPHGFRRHVLAKTIRLVVDAIDERGNTMIGVLMAGNFKVVPVNVEKPNE